LLYALAVADAEKKPAPCEGYRFVRAGV